MERGDCPVFMVGMGSEEKDGGVMGENGGQGVKEHGFAGARGADDDGVVEAGGCDFQASFGFR